MVKIFNVTESIGWKNMDIKLCLEKNMCTERYLNVIRISS